VVNGLSKGVFHVVVMKDSGISSMADIKGKRVVMGPAGGGAINMARDVWSVYGFGIEDISATYVSYSDGISSLKDGKVDAIVIQFAAGVIISGVYVMAVWQERILKSGISPVSDVVMGTMAVILILEATRRTTGKFLAVTVLLFIIYALTGPYMPGFPAYRGETWDRLMTFLYMTTEGIFGVPLGIAASYIIMFVIFGAFQMAMFIITIILGCGMPPTAVYIILAAVLAPPLIKMGVMPIAAGAVYFRQGNAVFFHVVATIKL